MAITLVSTSKVLYERDGFLRQSVDDGAASNTVQFNYRLGRTLSVNDVFHLTVLIMIYSKSGFATSKILIERRDMSAGLRY